MEPETSDFVEGTVRAVLGVMGESAGEIGKKVKLLMKDNFKSYLSRRYESLSNVKNILYKNNAVDLTSFYVDVELVRDDKIIKTGDIEQFLRDRNRLIIEGPAGSGKSLFSRYVFMKTIEDSDHGIPIHLKLRKINDDDTTSILEKVFKELKGFNRTINFDHFEESIKEGKFLFILDGLDEVKPERRSKVEKEIQELADKFSNNKIILFSRPSTSIEGWDSFENLRVRELTKEKAVELVEKVRYDEEVKQEFLDEIEDGLFERYRDFLSNPLLLTMMLITYSETSGIPSKMHVYYERVFEVLFDQHDVSKGRYKRVRYTDLPIDEFRNLLSALSFITYFDNKNLTRSKTLEKIKDAIELSNIEGAPKPRRYLKDLTESVCILIKDGLEYAYTHRSFQEYFTALFVSQTNSENKKEIIERLSRTQNIDPGLSSDSSSSDVPPGFFYRSELTLYLLYGIDPSSVDRSFFIPFLQSLIEHINNLSGREEKLEFLYDVHPHIAIVKNEDEVTVSAAVSITHKAEEAGPFGPHVHSIYSCYPSFWDDIFNVTEDLSKIILDTYGEDLSEDHDVIRLSYDQDINGKILREYINPDWYIENILNSAENNLSYLQQKYSTTDKEIRDIVGI